MKKPKTNIIHLVEFTKDYNGKKYPRYKCIAAVGIAHPMKSTFVPGEVTCKNCIKWYLKGKKK